MKSGLYILVPMFSFWLGWCTFDPMERNEPRSPIKATAARIVELEAAVKAYYRENKVLPKTLKELCRKGYVEEDGIRDGWGCEFFYSANDERTAAVWSFGPNSEMIRAGEVGSIDTHYRICKRISLQDVVDGKQTY